MRFKQTRSLPNLMAMGQLLLTTLAILFLVIIFPATLATRESDWNESVPDVGQEESPSKLVSVAVISRHGQRTPSSMQDFNLSDSDADGHLTGKGVEDMKQFGGQFRAFYSDFFKDGMPEIVAKSSTKQRCVDSAASFVSGLNPEVNISVVSSGMLTFPRPDCPAVISVMNQILASEEYSIFLQRHQDLGISTEKTLKRSQQISNKKISKLAEYITIKLANGETLPDGISAPSLQHFRALEALYMCSISSSQQLMHLQIETLMQDVLRMLQEARGPRIVVYNTHDIIIDMIARTMGAFADGRLQPYAASFILESHQDASKNCFVKAFYWTPQMKLPGSAVAPSTCDKTTLCQLDEFADGIFHLMMNQGNCKTTPILHKSPEFFSCFD